MLKAGVDKNIKQDFFKEVKIMAGVRHENVVRLLGVCKDDPMCMIVEYMENGDLNQFLKQRELASGNSADPNKVTYQALLYMALQLAAGMKYIASHQFVHRDLATRNCLVGHSFTVKIADFGMSRHLYSKHYYRIQGRVILPIRWMAPECILQGKFTSASDVWAFGVTLWEILTLAAEYPYGDLTDEKVIENVQLMFFRPKSDAITFLSRPEICPPDVYAKMRSCWAIEPSARPDFHDIHSFLENRVALSEMTI
ncbi:predicted protein [Nematostella vectensis]|uniref:Protein kinase domain-containing protein n=2 Tax=Nematostella vectensis TaxID=45351 RepID=A7RW90_NEMVE|nr:predicted protein [Nematostella vectensis]|eukprot:XP_001636332.1 predicted protein [Nematostella vectensis]